MVKFVETDEMKLSFISEYEGNDSIIFPLFQNRVEHPIENRLLGAFVFINENCWVLMDGHNDCGVVDLSILERGERTQWIFDTKWILHILDLPHPKSIDVSYHLTELSHYNYDELYRLLVFRYRIANDLSFIPIVKIIEVVTNFVDANRKYISDAVGGFDRYNGVILPSFLQIERNGIPTVSGKEFSLYNNFTTTGRPTNGFGGVNYSALNKSDGSRDRIVSENDEFYQYDFDGYHIRLIGKLINEPIPATSAHEWLGRQYFGKDVITDEEYANSKAITFRQLYGGIDAENLELPFYDKTNRLIQSMYKEFLINGYIETKFGKRIPFTKIDAHNPQKVFNYYLQSLETEVNVMLLAELNTLLKGCRTKLVLYTYDSFLFDLDAKEMHIIPKIESILNKIAPTDLSKNHIYGKI